MLRGIHRPLATVFALAMVTAGVVVGHDPAPVTAASAPWTLPTVPPKCSSAQIASGNVAGCVILGTGSLPEAGGWPTPPFPTPADGTPAAWTDMGIGATGSVVALVQEALIAAGYSLSADGQFGAITESRVKSFQTSMSLPATGVVDQATADALGVTNTIGGTFPPAGWTWSGWGYNGSTALAGWEAQIVGNAAPISTVKTGQLKSMPDALPLFEGFVREITAGGYVIKDLGGYVFRCTASTTKTCAGLTRAALSNHAYGLAIDFNTAANPMTGYSGINGATACATPMKTDIPQWVVQAAERWGLYWGGYGWSSGCSSPSQVKSYASRDAMHFEFNGTTAQAQAILAYHQSGVEADLVREGPTAPPPPSCVQLVNDRGDAMRCLAKGELPAAGSRLSIGTNAPAGSAAALVNLTVTDARASGYITADACTAQPAGPRAWSNGNAVPGTTAANLAVVPLDAGGRFCLYLSAPMHTVVDVQGFFAPASVLAGGGSTFIPIAPQRVIDTRSQTYCGPAGGCVQRGPVASGYELAVTSPMVPQWATAVLANLTVTEPSAAGYTTADRCDSLVPGPQSHSNINFGKGATVANLAVVPTAGASTGSQFCSYSTAAVQTLVDVQGFFAPATSGGLGYTPLTPGRLLDTRGCWTDPVTSASRCQQLNQAGSIVHVRAPAGAAAVLVNLTLTDSVGAGYATADQCSALGAGPQTRSNANTVASTVTANLAVVPVGADGMICVYLSSPMHLVVDLQGSFSSAGAMRFSAIAPERRLDTRLAMS